MPRTKPKAQSSEKLTGSQEGKIVQWYAYGLVDHPNLPRIAANLPEPRKGQHPGEEDSDRQIRFVHLLSPRTLICFGSPATISDDSDITRSRL
jgi:hypothetical protein